MSSAFLRPILIAAALLGPLAVTKSLGLENAAAIAIFISIVILWLTEWLPLAVTGILVPVLLVVYGVFPHKEAFLPFGNSVLFLFIGCFLMARAMEKHGWDRRMAYWILSSNFSGSSPAALVTTIGSISFLLSMWVSNTATAAMMMPICLGIVATMKSQLSGEDQQRRFEQSLILTAAFAASIGGLATPVGSPPNLIALEHLKKIGVSISFLEWMAVALPMALVMFAVLIVIMRFRFPVDKVDLTGVREHFQAKLRDLGPLRKAEVQVVGIFALAILLWVLPSLLELISPGSSVAAWLDRHIPLDVAGIGAALLLFVLKVDGKSNLAWEDAKEIDWGCILLFGGGLALGMMLDKTGLAATLGELSFNPEWGLLALIAGAVLFGVVMSEFSSNTASAAIVIPIVLTVLGKFENVSPAIVVMACAFGASYGFMLPVSTPPNAIAYGTGRVPAQSMFRTGLIFDIIGAIIIIVGCLLLSQFGVFTK